MNIVPVDKPLPLNKAFPAYAGVVKDFCTVSHLGHLQANFDNDILFYIKQIQFHKTPSFLWKDSKHAFNPGDEVKFNLKKSLDPGRPYEACNLQFIKNDALEDLRKLLLTGAALPGTLLYLNHKFYVRDYKTNILIPVIIEDWETDQEEVYDKHINKQVTYKALNRPAKAPLLAALTDRRFSAGYEWLYKTHETKTAVPACITGKNEVGYFATIQNGASNGFIYLGNKINEFQFNEGDVAQVFINKIRQEGVILSMIK